MADRANRGRQKIQMRKMENNSNLQVTFSKRRCGLFKKASELSTLTGVEIAMIIHSPGNKTYSFGHPSVQAVIDRYLGVNPGPATTEKSETEVLMENFRKITVNNLNEEYTAINEELQREKKKGEVLNLKARAGQAQNWYERPVDGMNKAQLDFLGSALVELRATMAHHCEVMQIKLAEMMQHNAMAQHAEMMQQNVVGGFEDHMQLTAAPAGPFYGGSSSSHGAMIPYAALPQTPPPSGRPWDQNLGSGRFY
ncbi:hypothetical protein M0R45_007389 [Rubus argutus]|uniref:MADS-box domain-containing protein n=1 Tax=Rubus argutus TaxID=59490 RepID=A0AAW1XY85_RUBAR